MSYTQKKVNWEQCNRVQSNNEEIEFLDDVQLRTLDSDDPGNQNQLIVPVKENYNEYGDQLKENEYGDISRKPPVQVLVRKQPHEDVINIAEGKTVLTKSIFYVDPTIEPNALNIKYMDKLDGETVIQKYVMCTRSNKPRMVRYITV